MVGVQGTVGRLAVTIQLEQQFQGFLVNSHHIEKRTALVFYVCLFSYITVFLSRFICCISVYENVAPFFFFFLQHSCLQTRIFFLFLFFCSSKLRSCRGRNMFSFVVCRSLEAKGEKNKNMLNVKLFLLLLLLLFFAG